MIDGLRDYQKRAIDMLYDWMGHNSGNPCIVAPTGSGKSWIIAALCEDVLQQWPETRILVLSHVKELLQQDADKILTAWPQAPVGVYSAGLKRKDVDRITVAGVQSIYHHAEKLGRVDLVLVDEAHLINHDDSGMYRTLLDNLLAENPLLRVVGLTATPYRLGHGLITEGKNRIFDGLIEPVSIAELVARGFLAPLRSKLPEKTLDVDSVHKRGGDYIESELQQAVDTAGNNAEIAREIVERGKDRKAWLIFCTGVVHAYHMRDELKRVGIPTATVVGETPADERSKILDDFKSGGLKALTNVDVLTTGFDYPGIDLLAMCRPTMSPGLYCQMAGRGMRVAEGKTDCLVLDFAGNVMRHGPITAVELPESRKGSGEKKPTKKCPQCSEIVASAAKVCPACGYVFPVQDKKPQILKLHTKDDIMGIELPEMELRGWFWQVQLARKNNIPMIRIDYEPKDLTLPRVSEYLCLMHDGYAQEKACKNLKRYIKLSCPEEMQSGLIGNPANFVFSAENLKNWADFVNNNSRPPTRIKYVRNGKYFNAVKAIWEQKEVSPNETAAELGRYSG